MNPFAALDANFSQDRLKQFYAMQKNMGQAAGSVGRGFRPPAQSSGKPKRNFWLDQLSTVGGIGGGIAGSLVAPIAGTAAGAGIGSALGETLENILDPTTGDWGNVGEEAALGAVFGAGPLKLGKAGLGALKGGIKAGGKEVGEQVLKSSTKGKLLDLSNKALASQYGTISKPVARETQSLKTISQLADMGIFKPKDAERIASSITGGEGILTQQVSKAIGQAGVVPTSTIKSVLKNSIQTNGLSGLPGEKAITATVEAQLKSLKNGSTPEGIMNVIRQLERDASGYLGKGGTSHLPTSLDKRKAAVLFEVRDELEKQLFDTAGANKNLGNVLTPELREQLVKLQPKSKEWQNFVDQNVMQAQDVGALRSAQAPFVKIGKLIDEADINAMTFGGRMGNSVNGGSIANTLMNVGAKTLRNPAARAGSRMLRGAANGASLAIGPQTKKGIAARVALGPNIVGGAMDGTADAMSLEDALVDQSSDPNMSAQMNSPTPNINSNVNMPTSYPNTQQQSSGNPYSRENLMADIQRDPANADKYIAYFSQLEEIFKPAGGFDDMSQGTRNSLASADNALNTVSQLEEMFNAAGGGGGRIGGKLKNLTAGAGFNEEAKVYNSMADASVTQIAKALAGSGAGTVSDMDAKVIMQALARFSDNPNEAAAKFAALRQRLEAAKNNSLMYGGGGTLEDTLTQGGMY